MNRLLWAVSFAVSAPCALIAAILLFFSLTKPAVPVRTQVLSYSTPIFESSPDFSPSILSVQVTSSDGRVEIVRRYLARFHSSLEPFAKTLVDTADKYSLDYRLLVAIAQQESNLCKKIPQGSYNCWGFGIYGDKVTRFDNYAQAIEIVSKTLKKDYYDKGLTTPEAIMAKYTPPSTSWDDNVSQFLADISPQ